MAQSSVREPGTDWAAVNTGVVGPCQAKFDGNWWCSACTCRGHRCAPAQRVQGHWCCRSLALGSAIREVACAAERCVEAVNSLRDVSKESTIRQSAAKEADRSTRRCCLDLRWPRLAYRWSCVVVALGLAMGCADDAVAWDRVQQLVRGTADTLEKGQLTVGIFAPVTYGITDNLTIASHPVLDLLLLPNVDARLRVWSGDSMVVALFGAYEQGFLPAADSLIAGTAHLGAMVTHYFVDRVALTAGASWSLRLDRSGPGQAATALSDTDHGVAITATASWMIDEDNLLMTMLYQRLSLSTGAETPAVTLAYVRDWGEFQVAIGPMFGDFTLVPSTQPDYLTGGTDLPVFLYVDIWWDF